MLLLLRIFLGGSARQTFDGRGGAAWEATGARQKNGQRAGSLLQTRPPYRGRSGGEPSRNATKQQSSFHMWNLAVATSRLRMGLPLLAPKTIELSRQPAYGRVRAHGVEVPFDIQLVQHICEPPGACGAAPGSTALGTA